MRKFLFLATACCAVVAYSNAFAGEKTGQGTAKATIIVPIEVQEVSGKSLNFGTIMQGAQTVVVDPAGNRTGDSSKFVGSDDVSAGTFAIIGPENTKVSVNLPGTIQIASSNGDTMDVHTFTSNKTGEFNIASGDKVEFNVGASLDVAADQPAGDYTGTYEVTVNF